MTASVTRRYHFAASHRLHAATLSDAENSRLYGKCNNPFGHGHNYALSITVAGPIDEKTGLVMRPADLDALMSEQVVGRFAHRSFNLDVPEFAALVPTTENIALVVAQLLNEHWRAYIGSEAVRLTRVHIQETDRNSVELKLPLRTSIIKKQESNESVIVHA